jgi:hypothetical protein
MSEAYRGARQRVSTGLTLTLGLVTGVLGLAGNTVASFVTKWSGDLSWFAVPVAAVAVAVVTAFATAHVEAGFRRASPGAGPTGTTVRGRERTPRTGMSLPASLLTVLLVVGAGGFAATLGVRYVVGYVSGNEAGVDRLVQPVTKESKGLGLTVEKFEETWHFTRLTLTVVNDVGNSLSLPVYSNCVLVGADRTTLQADAFRSDWSETVADGSRQTGTIVFNGHLPPGVLRASVAFSTVFEQGFKGPSSIRLDGLRLRPGQ